MSAAHTLSEPTPLYVAHRNAAPTAAKMNLYDLMGRFWQLNDERVFTANETRLYFYLLNQFNAARWAASLARRPGVVCAELDLTDKTLATARVGLVARGLLHYTEGHRRLSAVWGLGPGPAEGPQESRNNSGLPQESAPKKAGIIPLSRGAETPVSPQESRNNSGDIYKEKIKTVVVEEDKDTPLPPEKKMEAGVSENSSPALKAKVELVPPVAQPPHDFAGTPAHSAEATALAAEIAALWYVTEQRNQPRWARIAGFVHRTEQAGQLGYLAGQFRAYRQFRELRGIGTHRLDDYLNGIWDECDWVAKAKDTRSAGAPGPPPAPKQSPANPTRKQSWS